MLKVNSIYQVLHPKKPQFLIGLIGLWSIYTFIYMLLKLHGGVNFYAGFLESTCGFIINFFAILLTFSLWKKTEGQNKIIFAFFLISLLVDVINNVSYNITVNVLGITHFSNLVDSVFDIPFLGFLIFQLLAWIIIFQQTRPNRNNRVPFISYLPVVTIALVIFGVFIFSIEWKIRIFSLIGFYVATDTVLQILGFIFALLCLCMAAKRQIYYMSIGYFIIITSCFMIHYKVLAQTLVPVLLIDAIWSLGALLMMFGFYELWLEKRQSVNANNWLGSINGIRAQCAFWSFLLCMASLAAFGLISYLFIGNALFNATLLKNMLPILIVFSILAVLVSLIFAKILLKPFGSIETVIDSFMQDKNFNRSRKKYNTNIYEFEHLENFLVRAFSVLEERNRAQRNLANCAGHVAHDVRKPFTMLKTMLQLLPSLKPSQTKQYSLDLDVTIRKVEAMLADIMEVSRTRKYESTPGNILSVLDLAIKDVSRYHPDKSIEFYYNLNVIPLIDLDEARMCRAFENIIDNAFDFLPDKEGFMWFSVKQDAKKAKVIIGNSHSHIPDDKIQNIFRDRFTSGKQGGTGLGLSIVTKVINGHDGSVTVRNVDQAPSFVPENIKNTGGVEFEITLQLTSKPGYKLKDPLLKSSKEAQAEFGMIQKESQLAGSSEIDNLVKKMESLERKPNLLILDDESIYRMRVRNVLEKLGDINKHIHVYDAASYNEAIEVLGHTKIDYLICDIDLSDKKKTGFSVLSEAKKKYPNCKVLMHTNRKEPEDIENAKRLGACGFCPKPITEAIFVDLLLEKKLWPDKKEKNRKTKKVIFLNDDELIGTNTRLLLKNSPYSIAAFTDVESALAFYLKNNNFYAILSDIDLGSNKPNGYDFLKEVRAMDKNIPFVFVSGSSSEDEWEKAKKSGATKYIQLPLEMDNLTEVLDSFNKRKKKNEHN